VLAPELRGAAVVAETFRGRAQGAQRALVDGTPGLAWAPGGTPRAVFSFTVADGKIVAIDLIADPERIREFEVVLLD
jgi:RNA polymerase sigma-70 factor (ECF subfamily)